MRLERAAFLSDKKVSDKPFFIAGPCVIEGDGSVNLETAKRLADIAAKLSVRLCFKSSFQKDNRTSVDGYRGVSREQAQELFDRIRQETNLPVTTDIHSIQDAYALRAYCDILQVPALLSRQTSILQAGAKYPGCLTVKKMQTMSPTDVGNIADKVFAANAQCRLAIVERATAHGYHDNIVDYRGFPIMDKLLRPRGVSVVYDCTHSVQQPSSRGTSSGGNRELVAPLARAVAATGHVSGFFFETHPNPVAALCDGPCMVHLDEAEQLMREIIGASEYGYACTGRNARTLWE